MEASSGSEPCNTPLVSLSTHTLSTHSCWVGESLSESLVWCSNPRPSLEYPPIPRCSTPARVTNFRRFFPPQLQSGFTGRWEGDLGGICRSTAPACTSTTPHTRRDYNPLAIPARSPELLPTSPAPPPPSAAATVSGIGSIGGEEGGDIHLLGG